MAEPMNKPRFRDWSIKRKISLIIVATCAVTLLWAGLILAAYEWMTYRKSLLAEYITLANITGQNCLAGLEFNLPEEAEKSILPHLAADSRVLSAALYKDGKIWAKYSSGKPAVPFPNEVEAGESFQGSHLMVVRSIRALNDKEVLGYIYLQGSLKQLNDRLMQYLKVVLLVFLAAGLVTWKLGTRLMDSVSTPILELAGVARVISDQRDYSVRATKRGNDEIGTLIEAFNLALEQIEKQNSELKSAADELRTSHRKLEEYSESLEDNVEERTRELRLAMHDAERARDTAEQANQAKSNFLAAMSHELRTPLTAIIGFSEILLADANAEGRTEAAADLERINGSGKHLLALINDILDISKVEAGKMDLHVEPFSIVALIKEVTDAIAPLVAGKKNRLIVESKQAPAQMHSDMIKARQCLFNLLSNANKFTHEGEIVLTVRPIEKEGRSWIEFQVRDTGIGMTPGQMTKLFKAFSQADDSTSRKYGGTGLGLALTRQFCEMMGGTVTAASEFGKGSTFTIHLPARIVTPKRAGGAVAMPLPQTLPLPGECDLLAIDDDPAVRQVLERILRPMGYRLAFAASGAEGLQLARELKPALISLDIMMPDMDGWMVLSLLKAEPDVAQIPVVLLTVCAEQNFGFAMGIAGYLKKPIDREVLLAAVREHVPARSMKHVLIVEDDPAMREMLRRILEKEGWRATEAERVEDALAFIKTTRPALILLDLMLPGMDGFQMLAELNKLEEWRTIPVIVVSAKDLTTNDRALLQGRVQQVLQKGSVSLEDLLKQVQQIVRYYLEKENPDGPPRAQV